MAFGLQYMSRVEISPNLDKTLNVGQGQDSQRTPAVWTYNASAATGSNDSAATVEAANYFQGAYGYLSINDIILAVTNDAAGTLHILCVATSSGAGVTVLVTV